MHWTWSISIPRAHRVRSPEDTCIQRIWCCWLLRFLETVWASEAESPSSEGSLWCFVLVLWCLGESLIVIECLLSLRPLFEASVDSASANCYSVLPEFTFCKVYLHMSEDLLILDFLRGSKSCCSFAVPWCLQDGALHPSPALDPPEVLWLWCI